MIGPSAISMAVNALREHLDGCFSENAAGNIQITISHPAAIAAPAAQTDPMHIVNIFVYQIEHGSYPADSTCKDPLFVKLHCLLTSFAKKEDKLTAGEMDLRILGHILRRLNEQPMLYLPQGATPTSPELAARLQIIPEQITTDEMNKIWATQSEISYHPSIAYEIALLPIPIEERARPGGGVVGRIGVLTQPHLDYISLPQSGFQLSVKSPVIAPVIINGNDPGWSPYISFMDEKGYPASTLLIKSRETTKATILIAGKTSDSTTKELCIMRQMWEENKGWGKAETMNGEVIIDSDSIDPRAVYSKRNNELSFDINKGHILLYAKRTWTRLSDGKKIECLSNPILLTITEQTE